MRQERFTEQAQEALAISQELVRRFKHSQWDIEHVLLALLEQEGGLVGEILRELKVDPSAVKREVTEALEKDPQADLRDGADICHATHQLTLHGR